MKWFYLLNKRLLKKISFLILLGCIPMLVIGVNLISGQDSGMLRIVLAGEGREDELAVRVMEELKGQDSMIQFVIADSAREAGDMVARGQADGAWIFREDLQERIREYVAGGWKREPVVTVVEREDNVLLQMSREKLLGALYDSFTYSIYRHYVTVELLPREQLSEEELLEHYLKTDVENDLLELKYLDGTTVGHTSYFALPLRGMLALAVALCGLACSLYYLQEEARGTFVWFPVKSVIWNWAYLLTGLVDVGLAVLIALALSERFTTWWMELLLMALFLLMTAGFSDVLRRICGSVTRLGALIPVVLLIMLGLCPIFTNGPRLAAVQLLLPPYYYLKAVHGSIYLVGMIVYIILIFLIDYLLIRLQARRWGNKK